MSTGVFWVQLHRHLEALSRKKSLYYAAYGIALSTWNENKENGNELIRCVGLAVAEARFPL